MGRIVVMVAMEEEAQFFYPLLSEVTEQPPIRGIVRSVRGKLDGLTVDVIISGIGAVYASSAITAALTAEPADAVLSCGCSGAHIPEQRMGDLVIGSQVVPLQAEVVDKQGKSRLAGVRCSMLDPATMSFDADPLLLRVATSAAKSFRDEHAAKLATASCTSSTAAPPRELRLDVGVVGSSDLWRQSPALIAQVHSATKSLCEEMEAHALAQVCQIFGVPFVAIKDVANSEIHPEPIQLEPTDSVVPGDCQVGLNAAKVTARTISLLATDQGFLDRCGSAPQAGVTGTKRARADCD